MSACVSHCHLDRNPRTTSPFQYSFHLHTRRPPILPAGQYSPGTLGNRTNVWHVDLSRMGCFRFGEQPDVVKRIASLVDHNSGFCAALVEKRDDLGEGRHLVSRGAIRSKSCMMAPHIENFWRHLAYFASFRRVSGRKRDSK